MVQRPSHLWSTPSAGLLSAAPSISEAVRSRKPVVEDAVFGHHAALACHMANESYFRRNAVSWDEASKTITS
jgi:hypothetical protein